MSPSEPSKHDRNDEPPSERHDLDEVLPKMYKELRALAGSYMRQERPNHTLQPTALINEAYLRICDRESIDWTDKRTFFATAAQMMRRLLVDHARSKGRHKRGGGQERVPLQDVLALTGIQWQDRLDIIGLDEALTRLAKVNEAHARIVELRFFAGLSVEETAAATNVSISSVERGWRTAKAWLYRELGEANTSESPPNA